MWSGRAAKATQSGESFASAQLCPSPILTVMHRLRFLLTGPRPGGATALRAHTAGEGRRAGRARAHRSAVAASHVPRWRRSASLRTCATPALGAFAYITSASCRLRGWKKQRTSGKRRSSTRSFRTRCGEHVVHPCVCPYPAACQIKTPCAADGLTCVTMAGRCLQGYRQLLEQQDMSCRDACSDAARA